jgi:uncharacterized protein (TIGR02611 family)
MPSTSTGNLSAMDTRFAGVRATLGRFKGWVLARPGGRAIWRIFIAVSGGVVLAAGLVMIPFPGPGWLVVFLGIGIWATEFTWAQRLLQWTRVRVNAATVWMRARPAWQRVLGSVAALGVTVAVIFLAAAYEGWFGLSLPDQFGSLSRVG